MPNGPADLEDKKVGRGPYAVKRSFSDHGAASAYAKWKPDARKDVTTPIQVPNSAAPGARQGRSGVRSASSLAADDHAG